ncbi:MAG: tripartite tricarboxylate transporter substrate binding protein [Proteobacteria bacterium]|nr:tripartite tricarboxylate transporter substrate binding protein [Burkholderiales bacterium]
MVRCATSAVLGVALFATAGALLAQAASPDRPVRIIVPFPPGGINDTIARPLAERMRSLLGNIVVENRAGAGGMIAATAVARAEPDGHTILLGSAATHLVGPLTATAPTYDPVKDFRPVAIVAVSGLAICVHPSLPVKTLQDFVAFARARPNQLSYASAGTGSATHLAAELFKSLVRLPSIAHVPYRGGAPALADLLGGHVPVGVLNISSQLIENHRTGKIRILAVTTATRVTSAPEIPAARESGLPAMVALNFAGLFVPAATPAATVDRIAAALRAALADPVMQKLLASSGLELSADDTPDKARRFIEQEITRWSPLIRSLGLQPG